MEQLLAGLGNRVFLMNNVNDDAPTVFHVRWVMSYLTGPLARGQIKKLMDPKRAELAAAKAAAPAPAADAPVPPAPKPLRPKMPRGVKEFFLPAGPGIPGEEVTYLPSVIRVGEVRFQEDTKGALSAPEVFALLNAIDPASGEVKWNQNLPLPPGLNVSQLGDDPLAGAAFADLPQALLDEQVWTKLGKEFVDWIYSRRTATVYKSPLTGLRSNLGEPEGEFRTRLVHAARETRDRKVEELRSNYAKKVKTLEDKITKAMNLVEDQKAQANTAKMDTAVKVGGTILSAILGKRVSVSSSRTAVSGASRAWKESRDVARASGQVEQYQAELAAIERECEAQVGQLKAAMDPMSETLEQVTLTPLKKNCNARAVGIVWMPYRKQTAPAMGAAW
jgi:hypothetical protein